MSEEIKPQPIALDSQLALAPTNAAEFAKVVNVVANGGGFPARFDTPEKRFAAASLATALMGKRWQLALNNIADIKGQMSIYGELPGALAEQTGSVQEKKLFCIDSDYNEICLANKNLNAAPFAGVCVIQRKGRDKKDYTYTLWDAEKAGQYPAKRRDGTVNNDSPWMKYTKIMLMRKAMSLAIKFEFADALLGTPIAEFDHNVAPDLETRDVSPDFAKEINDVYGEETTAPEQASPEISS